MSDASPQRRSRLTRFARNLRELRRLRLPFDRRNIRAMWLQSDPHWLDKQGRLLADLTDDEYARWQEALRNDYGLHT